MVCNASETGYLWALNLVPLQNLKLAEDHPGHREVSPSGLAELSGGGGGYTAPSSEVSTSYSVSSGSSLSSQESKIRQFSTQIMALKDALAKQNLTHDVKSLEPMGVEQDPVPLTGKLGAIVDVLGKTLKSPGLPEKPALESNEHVLPEHAPCQCCRVFFSCTCVWKMGIP